MTRRKKSQAVDLNVQQKPGVLVHNHAQLALKCFHVFSIGLRT